MNIKKPKTTGRTILPIVQPPSFLVVVSFDLGSPYFSSACLKMPALRSARNFSCNLGGRSWYTFLNNSTTVWTLTSALCMLAVLITCSQFATMDNLLLKFDMHVSEFSLLISFRFSPSSTLRTGWPVEELSQAGGSMWAEATALSREANRVSGGGGGGGEDTERCFVIFGEVGAGGTDRSEERRVGKECRN